MLHIEPHQNLRSRPGDRLSDLSSLADSFIRAGPAEFIENCDTVVMGRTTFIPALGAPAWPWPGLQVYVLTSGPLPAGTPGHVIAAQDGPDALVKQLRSRGSDGDVHLVGGPRTIRAFHELGALDRLEIVVLPLLLGAGIPLSPPQAAPVSLRLLQADRTFPDGSAELIYAVRNK
jgi:dihydrofolate reductase